MSNIVPFPLSRARETSKQARAGSGPEQSMEDARDRLGEIFAELTAIQDELIKSHLAPSSLLEDCKP